MDENWSILSLSVFAVASALYFTVRCVVDWRARRYGWAIVTTILAVSGLAMVSLPIKTHAVKIDLSRN